MAQNKILSWVLLAVVFVASAALGFVLSGIILGNGDKDVDPEPVAYTYQEDTVSAEEPDTTVVELVAEEIPVEEVEAEPEVIVYEKFTAQQMEDLINSGDFYNRPDNSKFIFQATFGNIVVTNLRENDEHPDDVAQMCSKVGDGFWTRVTDTRLTINEQNIITRIQVTAVYPEE